ncbi:efflux RND transporter periplasmic adaptor subunit [Shewanella sp. KT0246]|uniref:efflux RND transporter periplasmic adaptor subunit n=1 Tax=Shewanella sp. KT0246 TaxID=2815912 RepID=UPI001BC5B639|nr:efflux RND transporter periplasmic adaptor subunit [Shewanella sp. KT0246]GIU51950.1 hypothetical protein TUM4249_19210 [Shewanella sp. KT0246]
MNLRPFNNFTMVHLAVTAVLMLAVPVYASGDHGHEDVHSDNHANEQIHDAHGHDEHKDTHSDNHSDAHSDEQAHDEHGHDEHGHDEHEEGQIHISAEQLSVSGIVTQLAQPGDIKQTVTLYGRTVVPETAISPVKARFSGLITEFNFAVGDSVKAGQVIAKVESNASLKHYSISAPISGVVVSRHANVGELATDNVLLTIMNDAELWVEYQIFPGQLGSVSVGQHLIIESTPANANKLQVQSTIQHLLNSTNNQAYTLARVPLDNRQGQWAVGALLSGELTLSQQSVSMVIDNRAVQVMEGQQVVFVRNEEGFEKRIVELGQSDRQLTEVLSGLAIDEEYAVEKSFLLKADLEKSSAAHVH